MNKPGKIASSLFLAVFSLVMYTCNTTEPGEENITPGRRDYEWTADTVIAPNNDLAGLWGASPDDLWFCGPGGITAYDQLWHYDGIVWKPWTQSLGTGLFCLNGLSANDIWMGGQEGRIFHFNGARWSLVYEYKKNESHDIIIEDIQEADYNNIYASGLISFDLGNIQRGFLIHYDGNRWKEIFISSSMSQFNDMELFEGNLYFENFISDGAVSDTIKFYKYDGKEIKEIISRPRSDIYSAVMNKMGGKLYFLIGRELYRYENDRLINILSLLKTKFGYNFYGRNEKDIFIRMTDGLAHYNGTDLQYLYKFPNDWTSIAQEPVIFEKDIFLSVIDHINLVKFILHGKLK